MMWCRLSQGEPSSFSLCAFLPVFGTGSRRCIYPIRGLIDIRSVSPTSCGWALQRAHATLYVGLVEGNNLQQSAERSGAGRSRSDEIGPGTKRGSRQDRGERHVGHWTLARTATASMTGAEATPIGWATTHAGASCPAGLAVKMRAVM